MSATYNPINGQNPTGASPYSAGSPIYNESTGYITPQPPRKRGISKWIKFGVPLLLVVVIAAVLGGVLGSRAKNNNRSASANGGSAADSGGSTLAPAAASSAVSAKNAIGRFATATNSEFMVPVYPSTTNTAAFTTPTFLTTTNAALTWPADPFQPSSPDVLTTRQDRPRLFAPAYKWAALPTLIAADPYLKAWNDTIFGNATDYSNKPPVVYNMDGSSGILDNAREIKQRIKAFAYVYRMTNDTKWVDRTWLELQNAAGNGTTPFGPDSVANDRWNSGHFLDTAEFTSAFGIAYDWMYDAWSDTQKSQIRSTMIKYGLSFGVTAYTDASSFIGWWQNNTEGNWNCVSNAGLTVGSLAILGDDDTGMAKQLLGLTVDNAKQNCAQAVSDDGTWAETANYWYFGTTGHAEMSSALLTATGSHYGLLDTNADFFKTGQFHMSVFGATSLFNYGDHGPNKFSSTANGMFLYARQYNQPQFSLFQREQQDAAEPWSMFWYDPSVSGAFWDNQPLDHFFDNQLDQWASMRSSWTDNAALFVGIKAGKNQGHQTHNDLDAGDFVLDALGTRWAGELGSGDYNSIGYFSNDSQISKRWMYYRKMTEGQNTILINQENQNVLSEPSILMNATDGSAQGSSTVVDLSSDSTALWVADLTSAYFQVTSVKRGIRLLNKRRQVLLQDEINAQASVQWRMHTNATVSIDTSGTTATLSLDNQQMQVQLLNAPQGAVFTTMDAKRFDSDVTPPQPDQLNPGVTVLTISLPQGQYTLQVLFNPQWPGMNSGDFVNPPSVALDQWSLSSHN